MKKIKQLLFLSRGRKVSHIVISQKKKTKILGIFKRKQQKRKIGAVEK